MYLMTYVDEVTGKIVYTLKVCTTGQWTCAHNQPTHPVSCAQPQKLGPDGKATVSAHPARFSPDDKFSRVRACGTEAAGNRGRGGCSSVSDCYLTPVCVALFTLLNPRSASCARSASGCCRRRSRRCSCEERTEGIGFSACRVESRGGCGACRPARASATAGGTNKRRYHMRDAFAACLGNNTEKGSQGQGSYFPDDRGQRLPVQHLGQRVAVRAGAQHHVRAAWPKREGRQTRKCFRTSTTQRTTAP